MTDDEPTAPLWNSGPIPAAPISRTWHPQSTEDLSTLRRDDRHIVGDDDRLSPRRREAAERLVLALDELASNGLRHGSAPVTVQLADHPDGWLVIVKDAAVDRLPTPAVGRPAGQGGYGLYAVAELAVAHGIDRAGDVKSVWALLPRS